MLRILIGICLFILLSAYLFMLLWQDGIPHGFYIVTVRTTRFGFELSTFGPYLLSFVCFWISSIMAIRYSSFKWLVSAWLLGIASVILSFFLSYGYTIYPPLSSLGEGNFNDPKLLSGMIIGLRILVGLVLLLLFFHWQKLRI